MASEKEKAKKRLFIGNLAELKFQSLAFEKGFQVSKPLHNNENYDFIIDYNGKINRIQIKATTFFDTHAPGGRYIVKTSRGNFYESLLYDKQYVDFIAIFVDKLDKWYILPVEKIKTKSIRIYPHKNESEGGYEKYLEAWELLK